MLGRLLSASAAVLMLSIAYQLGVTNARGQSSGVVADAYDTGLGSLVVTPSGAVYVSNYGTLQAPGARWSLVGTISSVSPIVHIGDAETDNSGHEIIHAFAQDGDFFVSADGGH